MTPHPELARLIMRVPGARLAHEPGDVQTVTSDGHTEVCFETGSYDVWIDGLPVEFNLTEDAAVEALTTANTSRHPRP